jgi:hypothetical protein
MCRRCRRETSIGRLRIGQMKELRPAHQRGNATKRA